MIAAYADGFRVLKEPRYRRAAESAADFLLTHHRAADGRLLRTSRGGKAKLGAYLEDYAFLVHGLLRLHAATGDPKRLAQARELADRMLTDFADTKDGGFFSTADGHESLLARPKESIDGALPSGNSVAIRDLVALGKLTGEPRYLNAAGKALDAFSPMMSRSPGAVPLMLVGLQEYLDARPEAAREGRASGLKDEGAVVVAEARLAPRAKAAAGGEIDVNLDVTIKPSWHIYAGGTAAGTVKPTAVTLAPGTGATLVRADYPKGELKKLAGAGEAVAVYEGKVTLEVQLRIDPEASPGPLDLEFRLRYQACDDRACLAPATLAVPLRLRVSGRD
jgi:hypothetical protein